MIFVSVLVTSSLIPFTLSGDTHTGTPVFKKIIFGSSPLSELSVWVSIINGYLLDCPPKPLLTTEGLYPFSIYFSKSHITMGVLPVPPATMLPTTTKGTFSSSTSGLEVK